MDGQEKPLTEAEKQIRRLETLRLEREGLAKASAQKTRDAGKTAVERTAEKFQAMRRQSRGRPGGAPRVKFEGKQKSAKLTLAQIRMLEQILAQDPRLRPSAVIRMSLNRMLGLDHNPEESDLEGRLNEILRQLKGRS